MPTRYVYARDEVVAYVDGRRVVTHIDEPWNADDPVVAAAPHLFADHPRDPRGTQPIEQATAAPGERRSTKRGRPRTTDVSSEGGAVDGGA